MNCLMNQIRIDKNGQNRNTTLIEIVMNMSYCLHGSTQQVLVRGRISQHENHIVNGAQRGSVAVSSLVVNLDV